MRRLLIFIYDRESEVFLIDDEDVTKGVDRWLSNREYKLQDIVAIYVAEDKDYIARVEKRLEERLKLKEAAYESEQRDLYERLKKKFEPPS